MPFLADPSELYKDSYIAAAREFQAEGRYLDRDPAWLARDFAAFVRAVRAEAVLVHVSPGRVPASHYWLIDDDEFIGRLSVRHELNEWLRTIGGHIGYEIRPSRRRQGYGKQILALGLEKAQALGLTRALITCDEDNIGSKKIIEHNGGQFENAVVERGRSVRKLRYWIDIP